MVWYLLMDSVIKFNFVEFFFGDTVTVWNKDDNFMVLFLIYHCA